MIHIIAFNLALFPCLAYSLKFGGAPERVAISAQLIAYLVTLLAAHVPSLAGFHFLAQGLALIDLILLALLTALALKANRLWTIGLAGLQFATILIHLSKALYPALPATSYAVFAQFWAWPMLITTAIGTRNHRARTKRAGAEQDWKPLWPHSAQASSWV